MTQERFSYLTVLNTTATKKGETNLPRRRLANEFGDRNDNRKRNFVTFTESDLMTVSQ